jgi:hypothetical protein
MAAIAAIARIAFVQLTFVLVVLSAITCDLAKVSEGRRPITLVSPSAVAVGEERR